MRPFTTGSWSGWRRWDCICLTIYSLLRKYKILYQGSTDI